MAGAKQGRSLEYKMINLIRAMHYYILSIAIYVTNILCIINLSTLCNITQIENKF